MKILLIQPPVRDFYMTPIRTQPLGLAYVAASLVEYGYDTEILNCLTDKKKSIPAPNELSYMLKFYNFRDTSPIKLYTGFYHFGLSYEEISNHVQKSDADVFGISSMFTPYCNEALKIAELIKKWNAEKIVVFGGAHTTSCPDVLDSSYVDYAVLGEGENRLPLLLNKILNNRLDELNEIDGIGYKKNGKIIIQPVTSHISDPDRLPLPDLCIPHSKRKTGKKPMTMILTSRGCPHKCAYCSHQVMGRFRMRSPEAVIEEMKHYHQEFGISVFDIEDDNFTFDIKRAKRLMNLIIDVFGKSKLELMAMNGISFAALDKELIFLMKDAGFRTLNLSYVSKDDSIKYMLNRPKPLMDFDNVVSTAKDAGLDIIAYCIFGMPGQTIREMTDTLIYLAGRRVLIGPSIYYPSPKTPMFEECQKSGFFTDSMTQWRSSAFPVETHDFSRLDLVTLFRLTRLINFIKAKIKAGETEGGITLGDLLDICEAGKDAAVDSLKAILLSLKASFSFFYLIKNNKGISEPVKAETSQRVLEYFFSQSEHIVIN